MTCSKKAAEAGGQDGGSSGSGRNYGYIDLFKAMGDRLPLQIFPLTLTKVVIGRDPSCQIRVKNPRISRSQCQVLVAITGKDFKVCLLNLTSRDTTVCQNQGLAAGEQVTLHHGFRFRVYDVEFRYRLYDPINEKGELDWSKPIPIAQQPSPVSVPELKLQSAPIPTIKVQPPPKDPTSPSRSRLDYRRQSFPLAENSHPNKTEMQSMLKGNGLRRGSFSNSQEDFKRNRKATQEVINNSINANHLVPPKPMMGNVSQKRRGSSDFDMRKAVLQRSFRRAFKEKVINGVFNDLNDDRYRRALEDLVILSSAA